MTVSSKAQPERPGIGKTFRVTPAQAEVIDTYLRNESESFPTFTQLIDAALHEFFQRRRVNWPETKYRRNW
jgi:hypothetical protein